MSRNARRALDLALGVSKCVKNFGVTSWKYLKVEAVPPFTVAFFNGPSGRAIERLVGKVTNGFIGAIESRIKELDDEVERERLEILAALKAEEDRVKAEAQAKELERIKLMAQKTAEAIKKAKALAEQKKAREEATKPKDLAPRPKPKDRKRDPKRRKGNRKGKHMKPTEPPKKT